MLTFDDDGFAATLRDETGQEPTWRATAFSDPEADVRQSIARIRQSPFVPHTDQVRGFVFDVASGLLLEVH
jgi:carbonic anhydrase